MEIARRRFAPRTLLTGDSPDSTSLVVLLDLYVIYILISYFFELVGITLICENGRANISFLRVAIKAEWPVREKRYFLLSFFITKCVFAF